MGFNLRAGVIGLALAALVCSAGSASAQISNGQVFALTPGKAFRNNVAFDPVNQVYLVIVERPPIKGRFYNKNGVQIGSDFVIVPEPGYNAWVSVGFGGPPNDPTFLVTYVMAVGQNPKYGRLVRYVPGGGANISAPSWIADVTTEWVYQEKAQNIWNGQQFIVGSRVMLPGATNPTFQVSHFHLNGAVSAGVNLGDGLDYYGSPALSCAANGICLAIGYMAGISSGYSGGSYARRFDSASLSPMGPLFFLDSGAANEDQGVVYQAHLGRFLTQWFRGGGAGYIHTRIVNTDGGMSPLDLNRGIGPEAGTNAAVYNPVTQTTLLVTKSTGAALLAMELGDDGYPKNPNNILLETPWDGLVLDYHPSLAANPLDGQWLLTWELQLYGYGRIISGNGSGGGGPNPVQNGDFSGGLSNWQVFSIPSQAVVTTITNGVLEFYRSPAQPDPSNQGVVLQQLGVGVPANSPIAAEFDLGNSSNARKRMTVLLHDANFSDLHVCTFWLEPFAPMERYVMRTHTQQAWSNATVSFYAATEGSNGGAYRLDNVSVYFNPSQPVDRTDCVDPTVPGADGGGDGPDIIANGNFNSAFLSWQLFGQISASIGGGALRFIRPAGTPAGALLQPTGVAHGTNTRLTAHFELGNSSVVKKRVTVILHDSNFSDLTACTFWIDAGQPLTPFTMKFFAKRAWANATISFYMGAVDTNNWALVDNVSLRQTPSASMHGTECISDTGVSGASAIAAPAGADDGGGVIQSSFIPQPASSILRTPIKFDPQETVAASTLLWNWESSGTAAELDRSGRLVWRSVVSDGDANRLSGGVAVDLTEVSGARLAFSSWKPDEMGSAEVQVSLDGVSWTTITEITANSAGWDSIEIALDDYVGQRLFVRLRHTSVALTGPSTWWVTNLQLVKQQTPQQ